MREKERGRMSKRGMGECARERDRVGERERGRERQIEGRTEI